MLQRIGKNSLMVAKAPGEPCPVCSGKEKVEFAPLMGFKDFTERQYGVGRKCYIKQFHMRYGDETPCPEETQPPELTESSE